MKKFFRQNKNVFFIATALFLVSFTGILFFMSDEKENIHEELRTDVVDSLSVRPAQEEEKLYRSQIKNTEDPFIVVNLNSTIQYMSWDFESATGLKLEEVKGQPIAKIINPEDLGIFLSSFVKAIGTQEPIIAIGPYRIQNADGAYHTHIGSVFPVIKHEKVTDLIITTRDITPELEQGDDEDKSSEKEVKKTSNGKKIRDEANSDEKRLMVEKLASR